MDEQAITTKAVNVTWRQSPPIEIEIDPNRLTWGHMEKFFDIQERAQKGEITNRETMDALVSLLEIVTDRDLRAMPARVISELIAELAKIAGGEIGSETIKN
jgi:hypothetical protein